MNNKSLSLSDENIEWIDKTENASKFVNDLLNDQRLKEFSIDGIRESISNHQKIIKELEEKEYKILLSNQGKIKKQIEERNSRHELNKEDLKHTEKLLETIPELFSKIDEYEDKLAFSMEYKNKGVDIPFRKIMAYLEFRGK